MRLLLGGLLMLIATMGLSAAGLPTATVVPDGLGVNIHFAGEPARDLNLLQAGGFGMIRMDFAWGGVEREKGVYDFTAYDQLTDGLAKRGIRPLYILDYSNPLYEKDRSVVTEEGRQAFARFAAAAAKHYAGRGILWELWNEPNIPMFWQPNPNANDYMALAKVVLPAIHAADPMAICVAPATSTVDLIFLEACFSQGLLPLVDAVSVHPYRQSMPESVILDIQNLRTLIARYSPDRPDIPVISGEWGYSDIWGECGIDRQGYYLPRQFLTNMSLGIPVSIWYDWHNDGTNPTEGEHHFGTVDWDYNPKPNYLGMQRLVAALKGMHFIKRLPTAEEDCLLLFGDDQRLTVAAWTTGQPHPLEIIPGQQTALTNDPQYLPVPKEATTLWKESTWSVQPRSVGIRGGAGAKQLTPEVVVNLRNAFAKTTTFIVRVKAERALAKSFSGPVTVRLEPETAKTLTFPGKSPTRRDGRNLSATVEVTVDGTRTMQTVDFRIVNPLTVLATVMQDGTPAAVVQLPEGETFTGTLVVESGEIEQTLALSLDVDKGQCSAKTNGKPVPVTVYDRRVLIPLAGIDLLTNATLHLQLKEGKTLVVDSGNLRLQTLAVSTTTARAIEEGDDKVTATYALTNTPAGGVKLTYEYGAGWKYVKIAPPNLLPIAGKPQAIGVWVKGNNSGCRLNFRYKDSNDRTFQPSFGLLNFTGWRLLTAPLNEPNIGIGKWGGAGNPDIIAYPIQLDTFILVDGTTQPLKDEVEFAGFYMIYGD